MDAEKELKSLLKEVADAKEDIADAKGQMKVIKKNLQVEAGTDSIKKAEALIKKWTDEADEADEKLEKLLTKLKEDYDW